MMDVQAEIERLTVRIPRRLVNRDDKAVELYETHSLKECAAELGIAIETVRRILRKRGVTLRPPYKRIKRAALEVVTKRQASSCAHYPQD